MPLPGRTWERGDRSARAQALPGHAAWEARPPHPGGGASGVLLPGSTWERGEPGSEGTAPSVAPPAPA
jgi:hypothetical protein